MSIHEDVSYPFNRDKRFAQIVNDLEQIFGLIRAVDPVSGGYKTFPAFQTRSGSQIMIINRNRCTIKKQEFKGSFVYLVNKKSIPLSEISSVSILAYVVRLIDNDGLNQTIISE